MTEEKTKQGGTRPGAGRKKKVGYKNASFYLSPESLAIIARQPNKNEFVDNIIKANSPT